MQYVIGTRGSRLSMTQTLWVAGQLRKKNPGTEFEPMVLSTAGDRDARPLFAMDQRGVFEREIDEAVAGGKVDFAVHSLKDVPSRLPEGLELACIPRREAADDILVTANGLPLNGLPGGAIIGTSSLRRAVQVRRERPDVEVRPIRGNIDTRLKKVGGGQYLGVVLARAGISRMGLDVRFSVMPRDRFIPAPGQGALAVVARSDDAGTIKMLKGIEDAQSRLEAEAERALSEYVDSGCRFPLGAHAEVSGSSATLHAAAFSADGRRSAESLRSGNSARPRELAKMVGEDLRRQDVDGLASGWREALVDWNAAFGGQNAA